MAKENKLVCPASEKKVINLCLTQDENFLVALTSDPAVNCYDLQNGGAVAFSVKLQGDARSVRVETKDSFYVLYKRAVQWYVNGKLSKEVSLYYDGTAIEVGKRGVFVGDLVI